MPKKEDLMDNAGHDTVAPIPSAGTPDPEHEERIAWWREARVGMFIHWGLYSLAGGIWKGKESKGTYAEHLMLRERITVKELEEYAKEFNPEQFDAEEWIRYAKQAGLKYFIITAKHHEGFSMYDTKYSDFNIVKATPFGRDPLKELADACKKEGIRFCVYYSHSMDWYHPDSQGNTWDYPGNIGAYDDVKSWVDNEDKHTRYDRYINEFAIPQLQELIDKYDPGLIWFDCGHKVTDEQAERFIQAVRKANPNTLINRRVGREPMGDYGNTSDNQPHVRPPRFDWESVATLNESWGYKKMDASWRTPREIMHDLLNVVSLGGNYVINVGPTGEGEFDPTSITLLHSMGEWMDKYGESIYGSQKSPVGKPDWGRITAKEGKLYLHVFDRPASGQLIVSGIRNPMKKAYALADKEQHAIKTTRLNEWDVALNIGVPTGQAEEGPDSLAEVFVLEYEGAVDANSMRPVSSQDYSTVLSVFDGKLQGSKVRYDNGKKDRDVLLDWSNPEDTVSWKVRVSTPGDYRIEAVYGADPQQSGGTYTVTFGSGQVVGEVEPTSGTYDFQPQDLGIIHAETPGVYDVSVKPGKITGSILMNLKEIRITRS